MGHGNSDRLYVTRDEMSGVYGDHTAGGGRRVKASDVGFERLPFDCCALTLQPWSIPVCSAAEGTVFELTNIIPFLKQHDINPATGTNLKASDLVRLHFARNAKGKYHDPVSFKEFNEHSHIVAIKTSGNVFSYDTVQQLNVKAKHMRDLVDDTAFLKKDILTLQDPHNVEGRNINDLHHIKSGLKWDKGDARVDEVNVGATGSASKVLGQLRTAKDRANETVAGESSHAAPVSLDAAEKTKRPHNVTNTTNGMMAASFTSSGLNVHTTNERQLIDDEEYMFEQVATGQGLSKGKASKRTKGYVRIETNFGPLDLELHIDKAPKTCFNFLELCKSHYYDNTTFHRLIPGFMVQGGDPTGTGRGGESIWGKPFRDEFGEAGSYRHAHRGTLSMANKGPNTNGSQWFLAFRKLPHLDTKHTVFGHIMEDEKRTSTSMATLDKIESVPTEPSTDRPLRSVRVTNAYVLENPYDEWRAGMDRRRARENMSEQERQARDAKRRRRDDDRTTWLGTQLDGPAKGEEKAAPSSAALEGVGRYMGGKSLKGAAHPPHDASAPAKRTKTAGGFGDFSSW